MTETEGKTERKRALIVMAHPDDEPRRVMKGGQADARRTHDEA